MMVTNTFNPPDHTCLVNSPVWSVSKYTIYHLL